MATGRDTAMAAARFAYGFLRDRFGAALGVLWLPLLLAGLSLYLGTKGYFEYLLRYLAVPDPAVARAALGLLAAGNIAALFFWSVGVAAIAALAHGGEAPKSVLPLRIGRRELRLYFGYLRFVLLLALLGAGTAFFLLSLAPLFPIGGAASGWLLALGILTVMVWFIARVGFLIPPVAATGQGTILRSAYRISDGHALPIAGLILLLLIPALLVHIAGEILLRLFVPQLLASSGNQVADYARFAESGLEVFMLVLTVSSFLTITLATAGAAAYHRQLAPQEP